MKKVLIAVAIIAAAGAALSAQAAIDSYWKPGVASYSAAGQFSKPMPWAPGQYVVVGNTTSGKHDSVSTSLLVSHEKDAWVIETVSIDKKGQQTVGQMMLAGMDQAMATGDTSKIELVWMKTMDKDGKVTQNEGPALAIFKTMMKSSWEKLVVNLSAFTNGGSVQVPAGSFADTAFQKSKTKVMGFNVEMESWYHSGVPVNGVVKSRSSDGKTLSELLAFGFDGKSKMP